MRRGFDRSHTRIHEGLGVRMDPSAGPPNIYQHQTEHQSATGCDKKKRQGSDRDASDTLRLTCASYAVDHNAEDDGRQHHPEQRYEGIAERLHRDGNARGDDAQHHREQDTDKDLNIELP